MSDIVTTIGGSAIRELCERLGADPDLVHRIEIEPRRILIVHEYRREPSGGITLSGPRRDALTRTTDVAIRWSE